MFNFVNFLKQNRQIIVILNRKIRTIERVSEHINFFGVFRYLFQQYKNTKEKRKAWSMHYTPTGFFMRCFKPLFELSSKANILFYIRFHLRVTACIPVFYDTETIHKMYRHRLKVSALHV
jgi:hypothetical protein